MQNRIVKVGALRGEARCEADRLSPNDLVILSISTKPLKYRIEKVEEDPVSFLLARVR